MTSLATLDAKSRPALSSHVRLRYDTPRESWVLLAPEAVLTLNETAAAILKLCDGEKSVSKIADELAARYLSPASEILPDVLEALQRLRDKGFVLG